MNRWTGWLALQAAGYLSIAAATETDNGWFYATATFLFLASAAHFLGEPMNVRDPHFNSRRQR